MKEQINEIKRMQQLVGVISEGPQGLRPVNMTDKEFERIDASPLNGEFDNILNELESIVSNNENNFKKSDIIDYFRLLIIDKFFNPGYLDKMWRE